MRFSDLPIDRPIATVMLLVSLMVLGAVAITDLPLDFLPLVKEPEIDVTVPFPGSHPLEALREVVQPIEEEIATIPGVEAIESSAGQSRISIETRFSWASNVDLKRMEVREAVERARPRLPEAIGHIQVEGDINAPGNGAALRGRISAERDLSESWELLDRRIKRPLERVAGVARVDLQGVEAQQVRIELDLNALKSHGIEPGEIVRRFNEANVDLDAGSVRGDVLRYDVRTMARFRDVETIRNLTLGREVRLGDVARVALEEPRLDYGRHLDRKFAIGIEVYTEPSANTVATVDRLLDRIAEIEKDPELKGIRLLVWNNAAEEIRGSLIGLRNAGLFGGLLAVVVLFLFLPRLRTTLVIAVAIPFSLVVTCGAMYALGAEFNVLTMLGLMLGVGMLVDNAVVVIENIHRLQGQGLPPREAARRGAREIFLAVVASTATTIIVWSWLLVTERSPLTIYIGEVALVICLAVLCSLLVSLTFIPLAAAYFAPGREVKPGFLLRRLVPAYRGVLAWTFRHRVTALTALVALAASSAYPILKIEKTGEPARREQAVRIQYDVLDPAPKEVLEGYVNQVEDWLEARQDELGYESLYSWYSENRSTMTQVYLAPERTTKKSIAALKARLQAELPVVPGVKLEVGDRQWWRGGSDDRRLAVIALHGEDPEYLEGIASNLEAQLEAEADVREVWGPSLRAQKEVRIQVDPARARSLGLTPQRIADTTAFAFRGRRLRRFAGEHGEVEVVMGLPDGFRGGLPALAELPVPKTDGSGTVPLGAVAELELARIPPQIERRDRKTTSYVTVHFDESKVVDIDQAMARAREMMAGFSLPDGYHWDFGEWGEERDETLGTMLQGVLLSILVILILMAALFESLTQPFAILVTLPFAFFGGFWALWMFDYELDAIGFIGVIILIGIVVNNGIVMVDHVNRLRREGHDRVEALLTGCGHRLRPVLMTAITTLFGLVPLALSGSTVAGTYIDSLAVVVIGGLATSTLFTLVALPVWYTIVEDVLTFVLRLLPRGLEHGKDRPDRGVLVSR